MKKTKRVLALILALLMVWGLSACGETPPVTTEPNTTGDTPHSVVTAIPGDNQAWVYSFLRQGAFSSQGYYYCTVEGLVYFFDFSSGISVALCSKAGCLHGEEPDNRKRENCEAHFSRMSAPMAFWEDHLYYVDSTPYGISLFRRNAIGQELTEMGKLGKEYTEAQKTVEIAYSASTGNWLYYLAEVEGIVFDEDTNTTTFVPELDYIGRVDLNTGKEEILFRQPIINRLDALTLCAAREDGALFLCRSGAIEGEELTTQEAMQQTTNSLKFWDGETGTVSTVLENSHPNFSSVPMVDGGKLYYATGSNDHHIYDLNTGGQELLCEDKTLYHLGGGYGMTLNAETKVWSLHDLQTGKILPYEAKKGWIMNMSDDGIILRASYSAADTGSTGKSDYYYFTYESLADGLQNADLVKVYTLQHSV